MNKFPRDFQWGGAICAAQAEGAYNVDGRGLSIQDVLTAGSKHHFRKVIWENEKKERGYVEMGLNKKKMFFPKNSHPIISSAEYYPNHIGNDFYHHYKNDIKLLAKMNFNSFRLSISWSRIFPNGDDINPNEKGLQFYRNVFLECKKYHISPLVTLSHYDTPLNLALKYGGWKSKKLINLFEKYVETVMTEYKGLVKNWLVFNEMNMMSISPYIGGGVLEPTEENIAQATLNQFIATALTVKMGHKIDPNNKIGAMLATNTTYPYTCDPEDQLLVLEKERNAFFFSDVCMMGYYPKYQLKKYKENNINLCFTSDEKALLKNYTCDFLGFSCYSSNVATIHDQAISRVSGNFSSGVKNPYLQESEWGWSIDPDVLRITLNKLWNRYHKPLWIVENGLGAEDKLDKSEQINDIYRINYLKANIKSMNEAINKDGIDVLGYEMWGCIDLCSMSTGEMKKRYGFIYVDLDNKGRGTLKRIPKLSFNWYKNLIKNNGVFTE